MQFIENCQVHFSEGKLRPENVGNVSVTQASVRSELQITSFLV